MNIEHSLSEAIKAAVQKLYLQDQFPVKLESTNKEFVGDYTFVVFPLLRFSKKSPEETAQEIGNEVINTVDILSGFNVVKGFLNLELRLDVWNLFLKNNWNNVSYGNYTMDAQKKVMVEYSSPNTNKPLHLGHVRNNLLGYSVANILEANGNSIVKANLINDRGIHICKSMLAWKKSGNGETPDSSGLKGDHLVGKYYVEFDKIFKQEIADLMAQGRTQEESEKSAPIILEAQEMLRKWEAGDKDTLELWSTMNQWVYDGFKASYSRLGVDFDKFYYESETYKLGKNVIAEGLEKGVFYTKPDSSVWIDLTAEGLDHKLVLRSDGTSVYITQDIGTADLKYEQFQNDQSIYVVGNEQDYHFKVLFLIMKKLGRNYSDGMHHLSYGMVDLPSGKMKSREGTVVDADDLMDEMHNTAKAKTIELGKIEGLSVEEQENLFETLGMAALKFYILKVDPKKRMLFNPSESIDFQGDTGPFVLYTYTRIQSMLRQAGDEWKTTDCTLSLKQAEASTLEVLYNYPTEVKNAGLNHSPAIICHYLLDLAKAFNRLYNELPVLKESDPNLRARRLQIASFTSQILAKGLSLLGIRTVDRM